MFNLLQSIRQVLKWTRVPVSGAGTVVLLFAECLNAEEPLVTNVGRFEIPFEIEAEPGKRPEGFAVLFSSQDGGRSWEKLSTVPAVSQGFTFTAPRDGHYSFAIRTTDAQGNLQQAIQGSPPELEVVVDTVCPEIQLDLMDGSNGQVLVNWVIKDASVAAQTLTIEFADGTDGRWKPVRFVPTVNGQAAIPCGGCSVVYVRAAVKDVAGNQGEKSSQLVLRSNGVPTNTVPPNTYSQANAPALGPSPFTSMNSAEMPYPLNGRPSPTTSNGTVFPDAPFAAAEIPKIQSGSAEGTMPQIPTGPFQPAYASNTVGTYDLATPGTMKEASYQSAAGAQLIKHHIFDLEYQVDDVGPSGVSAVELFVTEDGGQHWFTYGNDDDLRSPMLIDTRGEGTFGFAVRVRNGLGFADDPPQPGQSPEMIVTVDESLPVIELAQPTMRTDGFGTIQLSWQVREKNPASTPVRLEYAAAPNGPWTPVFDWQYDQSSYQWGVRPGTPTQMYFRLLARDAAGNVASAQTTQAVVVDLRRPVGRLLRVQAVSQPGIHN